MNLMNQDFRSMAAIMVHEVQRFETKSFAGTVFVNALDKLVYMRFLLQYPELVQTQSNYTQRLNVQTLAFLNSGEPGTPDVRLTTQSGTNVAPGSPRTFKDFMATLNRGTTGNDVNDDNVGGTLLRQLTARILGDPNTPLPDPLTFQQALNMINGNINLFTYDELVRVAQILQLNVPS